MSDEIMVSGYESDFVAYKAPSGAWNVNLDAYLVSLDANFGFNLSPHSFGLQFIPTTFKGASGQLPEIGTYTTFEVRQGSCSQGFLIAGNVVHADYQDSNAGTVVKVDLEDRRKEVLDALKISTEDLGDTIPSGLISVAEMYRQTVGFDDLAGNISDSRVKEYRNIADIGATYQQIYEAVQWSSGIGRTNFDAAKLPHPTVVAANTLDNLEPIRWKFSASPLSTVISTVLSDTAYDWYWGMKDDAVKIVNRKVTFDVNEDSIAIQKLSPEGVDFRFGVDVVASPSKVDLLGANQEGILNSPLLSPIDGITSPSNAFIFTPAWNQIKVSFIDYFGAWRSYFPTDVELQMAIKGIEYWTFYKLYQTTSAPNGWGLPSDEGTIAAQNFTFQSRLDPLMPVADYFNSNSSGLRIISNRVDKNHNWVLEWFAAISNHASNHYGRTYALSGFAFDETFGEYKILEAAWCNLENQRQNPTQPFTENYHILSTYAPVAPFVTQDYRVASHCTLPSGTVYGADGYQPPAAFVEWNEAIASGFDHYIPVSLTRVGQRVINPRDPQDAFEDYPEGTVIAQLPILAGIRRDSEAVLGTVVALWEFGQRTSQSGIADSLNPYQVIVPYEALSGVAIPVQTRKRYGQSYPEAWTSGTGSGTRHEVIIDDNYAPWNYFPIGQKTSTQVMSERASGFMNAKVVGVSESRFAEINKIDWPIISFDGFAEQNQLSGVYGRRDHGITEISVQLQDGVPRTKYGIKSYFSEFGTEAPLGEQNIGILEGIIHPIDFTEFRVTNPGRPGLTPPPFNTRGNIPFVGEPSVRKEVYAITITSISNRGSTDDPERYFSVTKDNVPKPGGVVDPLDQNDLICRDGFFNVGDHGLYIVEYGANGIRRRYYTGGTDLAIGAFVVAVESVGASTVDVSYRGFNLTSVPLLSGISISDITAGDQGKLLSDGTQRPNNENNINGVRPDRNVPAGIYFEPAATGGGTGTATPVVISGILGFGTASALADVQGIWPSGVEGQFVGSGIIYENVEIIPYPEFAQSGDIGILASHGGQNFVFLNRQAFAIYNS